MQHLLHVEREQEELREHCCGEQQPADVGRGQRPEAEDPQRQKRRLRAHLDRDEPHDQRGRCREQSDRLRIDPAVLGRAGHRVDQQHQAAGDRSGTRRVEVPVVEVGAAFTQHERDGGEDDQAGGDVDEEDPRPAEGAGQRAAEQHAGCAAAARGGAPDTEREVALAALRERRGQDREGCRRQHRRAEPLERAEGDQRSLRPGEPVEQRTDREDHEACDEEPAAPEQVGEPAAEQERAAEEDRVGGDHPLQALLAEVQVGLDRGQCDVDDRNVQDDHELGGDDDRESEPAFPGIDGSH